MVLKIAACPEAVPTAAVPPSRAAARFSNTATVGLWMNRQLCSVDVFRILLTVVAYIGNPAVKVSRLLGSAYTFGMGTVGEDERLQGRWLA